MDEERLEQKLRDYFKTELKKVEPSSEWWNKAISRIGGEPSLSFREWFSRLLSKPVWRAALPVVLILVVGALWVSGVIPGFQNTPTPITAPTRTTVTPGLAPKPILSIEIAPEKTVYSFGESVTFKVSIINVSPDTMDFGPVPPTTKIYLPGGVSGQGPDPELVATFAPGTGEVKLEPGEKITYSISWDQRDSGGKQVPPGPYFPNIKASDITIDGKAGPRIGTAFGILIQRAMESGERIVEVNQYRSVENNVFTLERIELKPMGMDIYASVRAADNASVNIYVVNAEAEYSIDGSSLKQAGPSEILHNTLHMWKNLPPLPGDARELTFIITSFGKLEGPWEFTVPLQ